MAVLAILEFAEIDIPAPVLNVLEWFGLLAGLILLIGVGVSVALRTRRWVRGDEESPVEHSLEHYQQMRDENLIDAEEFERIRARLGRRPPPPTIP